MHPPNRRTAARGPITGEALARQLQAPGPLPPPGPGPPRWREVVAAAGWALESWLRPGDADARRWEQVVPRQPRGAGRPGA